jgi:hypothetical protein
MRKIAAVILLSIGVGFFSISTALANSTKADCSKIQQIKDESPEGTNIEKFLIASIRQQHDLTVRILKFRTIEKLDRWIITEVEFDLLEPGIFVIEKVKTGYRFAAVYGGVELDNPEDTIRSFFIKELPQAPEVLFYCYNPKGAPFREGSQ